MTYTLYSSEYGMIETGQTKEQIEDLLFECADSQKLISTPWRGEDHFGAWHWQVMTDGDYQKMIAEFEASLEDGEA